MEKDEKWISQERLKKWLKIFVIFLAVMWVCTIISKSIYVAQLPRVQVKTLEKKYIEKGVKKYGIDDDQGVIQEQRAVFGSEGYGRRLGAQHQGFQDIWIYRAE